MLLQTDVSCLVAPSSEAIELSFEEMTRAQRWPARRLDDQALPEALWLGDRRVGPGEPALLVAEIGNNHNGSLDAAKRLIDVAAEAGADCAKFQLRHLRTLYRNGGATADHREDLGPQYTLDLLERFSLDPDEMVEAFEHTRQRGLIPLCTPWDEHSADLLDAYGMPGFKVASADLTNHGLLAHLAGLGRPLIVSTGMSSEAEIVESVELLRATGVPFALLHCNSTYPVPFKDVNLSYLKRLAELGRCPVGYSGHERGFHVVLAAVALGATIVEKHITLDRSWEGNDHKVSLEPAELVAMVRQVREVEEALGAGGPRGITAGELMNRVNLAKSLVARVSIPAGTPLRDDMIEVRSPGRGLQPNRRGELVGRVMRRSLEPGDFFFPSDLSEAVVAPRPFRFRRPFGLPVRFHDFRDLAALSNPDFLEFHMSYRDLELDVTEMVPEHVHLGLVVHSPELFPGDHLMNLASDDEAYRSRSIAELQRVVERSLELAERFDTSGPVLIVANLGGFTSDGPLPACELPRLYEKVALGLEKASDSGVEILPQTMPPFPWLLGGQLYHNLFLAPEDAAHFAAEHGRRLCLDVAHTKLATNHRRESFAEAIEILAPHTAHVHAVDAAGVDDEGLQIGEGEVDFAVLAEQLDRLAPQAGFIPEIWQGHQNLGEGFWVALDRLERSF
ncbi:MAG TPA: N-acetylneuraminate synthase family protein [Acidimicrobiales bacterium]|nr:N-acetylneuraminate synthase family protein [Acidimicrobiales bacterium]